MDYADAADAAYICAPTYEHPIRTIRTVTVRDAPDDNQLSHYKKCGDEIMRCMLIADAHLDEMNRIYWENVKISKRGVHYDGADMAAVSRRLLDARIAELNAETAERLRAKESNGHAEAAYGRPPKWLAVRQAHHGGD